MTYVIYKATRNTLRHLKQYFFIIVQIAIGMCLLFESVTIQFSLNAQLEVYRSMLSQGVITISGYTDSQTLVITPEDYRNIREDIVDGKVRIGYSIEGGFYVQGLKNEERISVCFANKDFYSLNLKMDSKENAYIGSRALEKIEQLNGENEFYSSSERLLFDSPLEMYKKIGENVIVLKTARNMLLETYTDDDYSYANTIFLPIELYSRWDDKLNGTPYLFIPLTENARNLCDGIIAFLYKQHPDSIYQYTDDYDYLISQSNVLMETSKILKIISIFVLVIVLFSLVGMFLLIVNRRKRAISISIMCGATKLQIAFELAYEVFFIVMIGTILGFLFGIALLPFFKTSGFSVSFSFPPIAVCLFVDFIIVFFVSLSATIMASKTSPIETLQSA